MMPTSKRWRNEDAGTNCVMQRTLSFFLHCLRRRQGVEPADYILAVVPQEDVLGAESLVAHWAGVTSATFVNRRPCGSATTNGEAVYAPVWDEAEQLVSQLCHGAHSTCMVKRQPADNFTRRQDSPTGRYNYCTSCSSAYKRKLHEPHAKSDRRVKRTKIDANWRGEGDEKEKRCFGSECNGAWRSVSLFGAEKNRKGGIGVYCRTCASASRKRTRSKK